MWELSNRTRFAAERTFARDRDGAEVLLVVVKATFAIGASGELRIADEQVPVELTPRHIGDPTRSSLLHDSDFALRRQLTDVLLTGHARARDDRPAIAVEAGIRIGAWQKRVWVVGDRHWDRGLAGPVLSDPEPFTTMPLIYERAFGGVDVSGDASSEKGPERCEDNPVGVGFARSAENLERRAVPNLEDPDDLLRSPLQTPRPMAFGPIPREWSRRRALGGTFDERWKRERRPLVPDDFDDAFWQSAPPDQRTTLRGGEQVELTGVSRHGHLRFALPRLELAFRSTIKGKAVEHESSLHTVIFEPDHDRVVLVHASAFPCHHTIQSLTRTVVREVGQAA